MSPPVVPQPPPFVPVNNSIMGSGTKINGPIYSSPLIHSVPPPPPPPPEPPLPPEDIPIVSSGEKVH